MQTTIIEFDWLGYHLQEPMALITNWLMTIFSFYAYSRLLHSTSEEVNNWKKFFLFYGLTTFMAGLGHLFFKYWGIPGKFPNWSTAIVSGYFAGLAMITNITSIVSQKRYKTVILAKAIILLALAIITQKFLFVAADAILTYVFFCGIMGYQQFKQGIEDMKYMVIGVAVCLPSIFIFFFKINPHQWLNKDDLSHLLMLLCIFFFYIGAKNRKILALQ